MTLNAKKDRLRLLQRRLSRSYRTNRILQTVRPNVHPKQRKFLSMTDREVFYGGAAGGGGGAPI